MTSNENGAQRRGKRCPGCSVPIAANHDWCTPCGLRMPEPLRRATDEARHQLGQATAAATKWLQLHPHATRRELDVLALVGQGLANSAIAERLGISPHTVNAYLTQLTKRWGCTGRAHLVGTAYQLGHLNTRSRNGLD